MIGFDNTAETKAGVTKRCITGQFTGVKKCWLMFYRAAKMGNLVTGLPGQGKNVQYGNIEKTNARQLFKKLKIRCLNQHLANCNSFPNNTVAPLPSIIYVRISNTFANSTLLQDVNTKYKTEIFLFKNLKPACMIKELNELIWYAQRYVWRDEERLADLVCRHPEALRLYRVLSEQHLSTDDAAARAAGMGRTSFKKYGKMLKEGLHYLVFFFNIEKARLDARAGSLLEGSREGAAAKLLFASGCRHASRELATKLLKRGIQYDNPEFVVSAAALLKESVLRVGGTGRDYEHYSELFWTYKNYLDLEHRAWECYQRSRLPKRAHAGKTPDEDRQTADYLRELEPHVGQTPSFLFHLFYFLIRNQQVLARGDYRGLLRACDEAIGFFEGKKYPVTNPISIFYYNKVIAYTLLGHYEAGRHAAESSLMYAHEGTPNWFNALEAYLYLALYTRHYDEAFSLYQRAAGHRRLGAMHNAQQEVWLILGAYCYIVHRLSGTPLPAGFPQFKSRRFLNEVPTFSKDKAGMNVAVLIAHVLLLLLEGRSDEVWNRLQALEKYRERHLRTGNEAARSEIFIRILAQLPRAYYRRDTFRTRTQPLLDKLHQLHSQLGDRTLELEIVPYETLTELIVQQLPDKKRSRPELVPRSYH